MQTEDPTNGSDSKVKEKLPKENTNLSAVGKYQRESKPVG